MKEWFESLAAREKQFVSIGAVVVIVVLIYGLGWVPFDKKHIDLKAQVGNWERALAELSPLRAAANGGPGQSGRVTSGAQSPIIIVDETLRSRGLDRYRKRSQPTTRDGIRIEFENIAFDELILWLGELSEHHAMRVQAGSFSVAPQIAPGRINASLTLERSL